MFISGESNLKKAIVKKQDKVLGLSIMLKCDFYGSIDRPNRQIHGFDDITLYFSKENFFDFVKRTGYIFTV